MVIIDDDNSQSTATPYELNCQKDIFAILFDALVPGSDNTHTLKPGSKIVYPYSNLDTDKRLGKFPEDPPDDESWFRDKKVM